MPPAVTVAGPVLLTDRSADSPTTAPTTVEMLLSTAGSAVLDETAAVLVSALPRLWVSRPVTVIRTGPVGRQGAELRS